MGVIQRYCYYLRHLTVEGVWGQVLIFVEFPVFYVLTFWWAEDRVAVVLAGIYCESVGKISCFRSIGQGGKQA